MADVKELTTGLLAGDRYALSKAITLAESTLPEHRTEAEAILEACLPRSGKSIRIGITGVPGVGKSTFIEALGGYLTEQGRKLAVLAIDPSSTLSRGSILGDKTRMTELSRDENAYIRPSASAGSLGGVARKTREAIILCEAAGFDIIFVETVGVGQSETAVHSMVDFFLLLMLAGAGDELQGMKRGIMEMADALVINKADGDNVDKARKAMLDYKHAMHLFPPTESGWTPRTATCSALTKMGIGEVWDIIEEHHRHTRAKGYFDKRRKEQNKYWLHEAISDLLHDSFYHHQGVKQQLQKLEQSVMEQKISASQAARALLEKYFEKK